MPGKPMRDVIVLLPGITGSVLEKDGREVWAISAGAAMRALLSLGRSVKQLALTEDPPDVDDLGDGVTAPRIMPDTHLIPGLWKIDGYSKIAARIKAEFDVTPGDNFFEFPYDWRRDNRVAARKLARQSHDWLRAWRERSGNDDAKLILVGHSMGGLVSRYFIECLDGWKDTRMLITFGAPYRGSLNALSFLANGLTKKLGPITLVDLSALLRSMTSVYQLLPIYPCYEAGGGGLARVAEADGVPNVDRDRAGAALAFHREIESAVDQHLEDEAYMKDRHAIHPMVGTFQPTLQSARLSEGRVEMLRTYQGEDQDGDGTVPRVSATPIELSGEAREVFVSERHGSLQNADPVLVQVAGVLSGMGLDLSVFRDLVMRISLDLEDAYLPDEPVAVQALSEDEAATLTAVAVEVDSGAEVSRGTLPPGGDPWRRLELPPLPPGTYRLTVTADGPVEPVTDVFAVISPGD